MVKGRRKSKGTEKSKCQAIKDWPLSERPREKPLHLGLEGLSDGELHVILLHIGRSGQTAQDLARQLISMFDDISGIDRAHVEKLLSASGTGIAKTAQLKAAIEIGKKIASKLRGPRILTMQQQ